MNALKQELTPSQRVMRDKLAHLTPAEKTRVLKMLKEVAPKHNQEVLELEASRLNKPDKT